MAKAIAPSGDALLLLLGRPASDSAVQDSLANLAHDMQPELDPESGNDAFVDWVTVNEIGLEYGFQDEAFVRALDPELRYKSPFLLTQLYFYGNTEKTRPFPYALPFGLDFADDRYAVQRKMAAFSQPCRAFVRDAWQLQTFDVTVAYQGDNRGVESVYCHIPCTCWAIPAGEAQRLALFTPDAFADLFGERWSSARLRERLAPLAFHEVLAEARSEHCADLHLTHGIEFGFGPGKEVAAADQRFSRALALASVTYYAGRVLDAREWVGPLPLKLKFSDSQANIAAKIGRQPDVRNDFDRTGIVVWHFERYSLRVEYSNIENRVLRVTLLAPGYWEASGSGGDSSND